MSEEVNGRQMVAGRYAKLGQGYEDPRGMFGGDNASDDKLLQALSIYKNWKETEKWKKYEANVRQKRNQYYEYVMFGPQDLFDIAYKEGKPIIVCTHEGCTFSLSSTTNCGVSMLARHAARCASTF
jgi:hypothetical protein